MSHFAGNNSFGWGNNNERKSNQLLIMNPTEAELVDVAKALKTKKFKKKKKKEGKKEGGQERR